MHVLLKSTAAPQVTGRSLADYAVVVLRAHGSSDQILRASLSNLLDRLKMAVPSVISRSRLDWNRDRLLATNGNGQSFL